MSQAETGANNSSDQTEPIPAYLRIAFNAALSRYDWWHWRDGSDEPTVTVMKPGDLNFRASIGIVCGWIAAADYNDPMPATECELLRQFAGEYQEGLTDQSYAGGARLLLKLVSIRKDKFPLSRAQQS